MKNSVHNINFLIIAELMILSALPIFFCFLVLAFFNFNVLNFSVFYSDELHYWNEINGFQAHGFNSGYSVINEKLALLKLSPLFFLY